jgi:hypothetical protein
MPPRRPQPLRQPPHPRLVRLVVAQEYVVLEFRGHVATGGRIVSAPTGLRNKAQGCSVGGTTLGNRRAIAPQPRRSCGKEPRASATTPLGLMQFRGTHPR